MLTTPVLEWFDNVEPIHQADIAIFASTMLTDDMQMPEEKEAIAWLRDWLSKDGEFPYRTLGKLCSFISVFEIMFSKRFEQKTWDETLEIHEHMKRKALEEGRDPSFIDGMINKLPQKSVEWIAIGKEWEKMKMNLSYEIPPYDLPERLGSS